MFDILEIFGVISILALQGYIFYITFNRIKEYKNVLLPARQFSIIKVLIKLDDINTIHPQKILAQLNNYTVNDENLETGVRYAEVSLVTTSVQGSAALKSILESINTYLIRNRSAVADFSLIKDIVERTAATIEEEVNNTISVPLYMGLLGTLLGIIF